MSLIDRLRPGQPAEKSAPDEDESPSPVPPADPPPQCGAMASVGPLGLDGAFPWDAPHAAAPASRIIVSPGLASGKSRASFGKSLLQKRKPPKKKPGFGERLRQQITGAAGPGAAPPKEQKEEEPPPSKRAGVGSVIRDCLSPSGLAQIRTMMYDPSLALTIPMRDVMGKLGRYGEIGDKDGVRRTVGELADKLNVGAPQHGTVLVEQGLAERTPAPLETAPEPVKSGKRSLDLTQGGRTLLALAPVLTENGTLGWKDGLARGWQRLNERFALQAEGVVDVLVSPKTASAAGAAGGPAPVGGWSVPAQAADAVGQWAPPGDAAAQPGASPVGEWSAAAPGPSAGVGTWAAPAGEAAGGTPAVGGWSVPDKGAPAGAAGAAPTGQWQTPPAGAPSGVGQWATPEAAAGGGAPAPVGGWAVPSGPATAGGGGPVGQWAAGAAAAGESGAAGVGQWSAAPPQAAGGAAVGQWSGPPAPDAPGVGQWAGAPVAIDAIKITDRMTVADVVQQNPNITGLRILEFIPQREGPVKVREIASLGAAFLKRRFLGG